MNVFGQSTNVFAPTQTISDRYFKLYETSEGRDAQRSSVKTRTEKGHFKAGEPQLVQRVTTNLMSTADDDLAMQVGAFSIFTEATTLTPEKGDVVVDQNTKKTYKIIAAYRNLGRYNLMVTELDD